MAQLWPSYGPDMAQIWSRYGPGLAWMWRLDQLTSSCIPYPTQGAQLQNRSWTKSDMDGALYGMDRALMWYDMTWMGH